MAILEMKKRSGKVQLDFGKVQLDLNSSSGNAFVLIGLAIQHGKQLGLDHNSIVEQMQAGDYENLLQVFDSYFGDYIDLYR